MEDIQATIEAAMDLGDGGDQQQETTKGGAAPQQALPVASKVDDDDAPLLKDPPSLEEAPPQPKNAEDDEDDDKMETSSTSSNEAPVDETGISPEKAELLLIKATGLKEEGNREFKEGELEKAARSYRRGVAALKKLNRNNTGDEQVKALLVTLHTNLSTVLFKQGASSSKHYRVSAEVAGKAIQLLESSNSNNTNDNDNNNTTAYVKALYRRAVANRKLANLEEARQDLRAAIALDANNSNNNNTSSTILCKKELLAIKKELESARENQKKALSKAFGSSSKKNGGGSGLYDDKEEIMKRRAEEAKRKQKQEEELLQQRKQQWEDECVALMAKGEEAISFDDWDKQRVEREEAKRKAEQEERQAAEKRRKEEQRKAKLAAAASENKPNEGSEKDDDDDDEDVLTEAELAMFRGYKKTADGRTTSYFTRELSEEEKQRIGDIAPKRLDETTTTTSSSSTAPAQLSSSAATGSAWNQAGTWEEKDTTSWCTAQLRQRLQETTVVTESFRADVVQIKELTGDASVAVVSGKKRYIFDFHVKLEYKIKAVAVVGEGEEEEEEGRSKTGKIVGSGAVRLPDICSTHHEEIAVDFESWKKRPASDQLDEATAVRQTLADHLRASVQRFVFDFNETY